MKTKLLSRRILAFILCFVMCFAYLPTRTAAISNLYGITAGQGTEITELSELTEETVLKQLSDEAALLNYGIKCKIVNWTIQFEETGQYVSPFYMKATGTNGFASFTMDRPEFNSELEQDGLKGTYKIAVQDASSSTAPVLFLPTTEDNGKLNVSIPISDSGVNCALFYVLPDDIQTIQVEQEMQAQAPKSIYENSAGSPFSVKWTTKLKFNDQNNVGLYPDTPLHGSVILKAPTGITFNVQSVSVESSFLEVTKTIPQEDGSILVNLEETSEFSKLEYTEREKMLNTDISISCDAYAFPTGKTISMPYVQLSIWSEPYNSGEPQPPLRFSISVISDINKTATMTPAVTITPADMTVYMGGDKGYEGVVDGNGATTTNNSLPEPLFKISAPSGSGVNPTELTFTNTTTENSWKPELVGTGSDGTAYYRLADQNQKDTPIRVQFVDEDGNVHESDAFEPTDVGDLYVDYAIKIFSQGGKVEVKANETSYAISANSGTLTVRAVEDSDPTSDIATTAPATQIAPEKAVAVAPEGGTTYTLNDTGVPLPDTGTAPSLLFDSIIEDSADSTTRTDALAEKADDHLGEVANNTTRDYEIKYLDLVDANNGNAWITSSNGTDIYWGYPEGTDQNTKFTLLHFQGLHRDGTNSGFNVDDIANVTPESIEIEKTETGIKFHVGPGGFSPFALVWETTASVDPGPGTRDDYTLHYVTNGGQHLSSETKSSAWTKDYEDLPTPVRDGYTFEGWYWDLRLTEPVTGDVKVDKATVTLYAKWSEKLGPDDTGVSGWLETDEHNAFLSGYPDGSFLADKNMTRAEVAQMFYALLLDKNVTITKSFSDVPTDAWYAKAVNTLSSLGMLGGYPDGTFRPDAPITRAEFAAIALAFAYDPASASCSYTDVNTSAWYYIYVAQATTYGWIGGYPDGTFRPNNSITRAEVAVIVNNMLGRSADESYIDRNADKLVSFVDLSKTHWAYYTIMEATNTHDYTTSSNGESWKA